MKIKTDSGIKVGDIMTRNFASIKPDANLVECAKEMIKKRTGSLVLKEGSKLEGLITERDIIYAMTRHGEASLRTIKAKEISPRKIATIKPSADLYEALQRMKRLSFKRLPVVVEGNVIGLLTRSDILKVAPALFSEVGQIIRIKEEAEKFKRMKGEKWVKESICEQCGNFGLLYKCDNRLLCAPCKEAM